MNFFKETAATLTKRFFQGKTKQLNTKNLKSLTQNFKKTDLFTRALNI